jgi:Methyltransferase domain
MRWCAISKRSMGALRDLKSNLRIRTGVVYEHRADEAWRRNREAPSCRRLDMRLGFGAQGGTLTKLTEQELTVFEAACRAIRTPGEEHWWIRPEVHDFFEARGFHIQPNHFYAPLPSSEAVLRFDFASEPFPLDLINFNHRAWTDLLDDIGHYAGEFVEEPFPSLGAECFPWHNHFYTALDALTLYTLIRRGKPKRIVEIGSGYSTHVSLTAVRKNGVGQVVCIEPYPTEVLRKVGAEVRIIESKVQELDLGFFESLGSGDILFIDSSHVSAFQSDVNFEFLKLLPRIKPGVLVHVHDIFFPWEYPKEWVARLRWLWNEQYLLYGLMIENPRWELIMPTFYTWNKHAEMLRARITAPVPLLFNGGSIWFRRLD